MKQTNENNVFELKQRVECLCHMCLLDIFLKSDEEQGENLKNVITKFKNAVYNIEEEFFNKEEFVIYKDTQEFIDNLIVKKVSRKKMYDFLWNYIDKTDENYKWVVLYSAMRHEKMPYTRYDKSKAVMMENDVYAKYLDRIDSDVLEELVCVLSEDEFTQCSEQASIVFDMLDDIDDYYDKIIFLSIIMKYINQLKVSS